MNYRFRIVVAVLLENAGVLMRQNSPHGNISRESDRLLYRVFVEAGFHF